jgi:hypothetical protein
MREYGFENPVPASAYLRSATRWKGSGSRESPAKIGGTYWSATRIREFGREIDRRAVFGGSPDRQFCARAEAAAAKIQTTKRRARLLLRSHLLEDI